MKRVLTGTPPARVARVSSATGVVLALLSLAACTPPSSHGPDPDLGPIDATLTYADRVNWPGIELGDHREIPFIHGFSTGRPAGYWFLGFAPRRTADSFWFCREGDTECPLDSHHRLNWGHIVGHPIFMRIPGQPGFSPFWELWTVRVPADFEPDSVKTMETLHAMDLAGEVTVAPEITDFGTIFGTAVGPMRFGPFSRAVSAAWTMVWVEAPPEPMMMPVRSLMMSFSSSPESLMACSIDKWT